MFPVTQVSSENAEIFEQLGTKQKFWYDSSSFLFKRGRQGTGENWAEVVAAAVAAELGLPHATYQLAQTTVSEELWDGVITPNFVPDGARLVLGNELIMPVSTSEKTTKQDRQTRHTIPRLLALLKLPDIRPPIGWQVPADIAHGARCAMAGYLMLDALIGNQDRHEENWGLIVVPGPVQIHLAPTFDHASSLGRNETDATRTSKLTAKTPEHGVDGFVARANSQFYDRNGVRLKTIAAFDEFSKHDQDSRRYWLNRLKVLDESRFSPILERIPPAWISNEGKQFAIALLKVNRRRLLELSP